jgi:glutamate 5-kinase
MARDLVRDDVVLSSRTWVVKVGTSVLTGLDGTLDPDRIGHLAEQISLVTATGRRVALVSSGAVGAGIGQLGLSRRPDNLRQLQAAAAVGQAYLIRAYDEGFRRHGRHAAQLLLTHEDFDSRPRYLNMRNTITALFEYNAVPVINENDTISVDEIKFGDNDQLAAMVAPLVDADLLVLLSDVEGLLDEKGARVPEVHDVLTEALPLVGVARANKSDVGTGGMASKLEAARRATMAGAHVIIADARNPGILVDIAAGKDVGTLFVPPKARLSAKKHWIAFTLRPRGDLILDAGAVAAVKSEGKSLLPVGILGVRGDFKTGDAVRLLDASGGSALEIGRGLARLAAVDALRVCGRSAEAEPPATEPLVHRDDLVVW